MEKIPSAREWRELALHLERKTPSHGNQEQWDAMAPKYARKPKRSGYIAQFLDSLELLPGESVFDMGCGPGVLSVPLAKADHEVFAVDFSEGMLAELDRSVRDEGLTGMVHPFRRAWQDDFDDLPCADVAISSRSMTTFDFADAVAKLESKARRRVIVSTAAGETPWLDIRLARALGRSADEVSFSAGFVVLLNYLMQSGRFPEVSYIAYGRKASSSSQDELMGFLHRAVHVKPEEEERFERFVSEPWRKHRAVERSSTTSKTSAGPSSVGMCRRVTGTSSSVSRVSREPVVHAMLEHDAGRGYCHHVRMKATRTMTLSPSCVTWRAEDFSM